MAALSAAAACLITGPGRPQDSCFFHGKYHGASDFRCKAVTNLGAKFSSSAQKATDKPFRALLLPLSRRQRLRQVVAEGGGARRVLYGENENYVLIEPGEDEQFVTLEELQSRLKMWLQEWPGKELPLDLAKYSNVEDAVEYLVSSVCELDLGGGQGSIQWFEVRLE